MRRHCIKTPKNVKKNRFSGKNSFSLYTWLMQSNLIKIIEEVLFSLELDSSIVSKDDFHKFKNQIFSKYKIPYGISGIDFIERYRGLIKEGKLPENIRIWKLLRKRAVRSLSGVSVISLLTKFWWCPGKCIYCPTYENLPKSYITNEPAVMRAELNEFNSVKQVQNRLRSLELTWHTIEKCDVRIIGGTWSVYPKEYKDAFIRDIYDAHTTFEALTPFIENVEVGEDTFARFKVREGYKMQQSKTLEEAQERNQSAKSRVIWMAIETRPDWINLSEIVELRHYWVTRVEIGYQTTIDSINELNKRGHGNKESIEATRLLKDAGFKVVAHIMPNLVWSTPELDKESLARVFSDSSFRPDELKLYPMVVTPNSELTEIWKNGWYTPYNDETLITLMAELQSYIPEYVRLNRMYRDIPANEILAGSKLANLRQVTDERMAKLWVYRKDISAREIRAKWNKPENAILDENFYEASGWHEYFLQFIDDEDRTVFSLLRLRVPSQYFTKEKHPMDVLQNAAIIREVHTFWDQLPIGSKADGTWQHMGFGKRLIERAETIIREKYPTIEKIAVISGIWVRGYYEKRWYQKEGDYMIRYIQ